MIEILTYALALAAAFFIGRFDLRTDDTGVVVGLILASAFVLGLLQPRRAWRWGVIIGLSILVAELYNYWYGLPRESMPEWWSFALVTGFSVAVGCAGAYGAALLRRHMID